MKYYIIVGGDNEGIWYYQENNGMGGVTTLLENASVYTQNYKDKYERWLNADWHYEQLPDYKEAIDEKPV